MYTTCTSDYNNSNYTFLYISLTYSTFPTGARGVAIKSDATSWSAPSDRTLKKNIEPMGSVLSNIMALQPVTFLYKNENDDEDKRFGFIAQDVQPLFPHTVSSNGQILYLSTTELIPCIVKAIQEQNDIIQKHESTIITLKSKITTLETTVATLQAQLAQIIERLSV
jgi:hypothetical protein